MGRECSQNGGLFPVGSPVKLCERTRRRCDELAQDRDHWRALVKKVVVKK